MAYTFGKAKGVTGGVGAAGTEGGVGTTTGGGVGWGFGLAIGAEGGAHSDVGDAAEDTFEGAIADGPSGGAAGRNGTDVGTGARATLLGGVAAAGGLDGGIDGSLGHALALAGEFGAVSGASSGGGAGGGRRGEIDAGAGVADAVSRGAIRTSARGLLIDAEAAGSSAVGIGEAAGAVAGDGAALVGTMGDAVPA